MIDPRSSVIAATDRIDNRLVSKARAIHDRVLVLDSHIDFEPGDLTGARNYTERGETQFNLPNMIDGGLDALFFVIYVGQTREGQNPDALKAAGYERAYKAAVEKFDAVHSFTNDIAPDKIQLATNANEVRRIHADGKKAALMGVENGYPVAEELSRVKEFYERGARYLSLAHNGHNQLADSHTGERDGWKWNGVSPLGKQVIAEMNRYGIMVDVSHASKESMMQTAALSKAPIIASHSAARALCNVSRNLDDEQLYALKNTGGVIQVVAYGGFIKTTKADSPERVAALAAARKEYNLPDPAALSQRARAQAALKAMPADQCAKYQARLAEIDQNLPGDPPATVKDLVDHIDYVVKLLGIDHVGISSDFDGGGGIVGWNDASETLNVTVELVGRGYTEAQIEKLWSGNLLRVMDEVQNIGRELII
ncbi:MAG TPA: dipeptidase [Candidatus Limnocylindrales bacterium]|nr:dipeptidase [Candidatus Limnocylindrales bacterium]